MADETKIIEQLSEQLGEVWHQEEVQNAAAGEAQGKALRKTLPRHTQGEWTAFEGRPDPVALLKEQGENRVQDLLPVRYKRMSASAFTFYRGAALIMASDLSHTPNTGITVQVCGDAHISNFGYFASPERDLVFDINDFDETAPGPWEWDIKRLATSVDICAHDLGLPKEAADEAVRACVVAYRETMRAFAKMSTLDVWYAHASTSATAALLNAQKQKRKERDKESEKKVGKAIAKAVQKDSSRAVEKLTEVVDGRRRFKSEPPLLVPMRDYMKDYVDSSDFFETAENIINEVLQSYCKSLAPDKQYLLSQYKGRDVAHKVVGTGSVGLFDWIVLLEGSREDDYLVLQIKQAQESVVERFVGSCGLENAGQRVVQGQRAIQTASDILLGWSHLDAEPDSPDTECDIYVRQLWDCKGSIDITALTAEELRNLATLCGWTLAHAHARTGNRFLIAGYLGKGTTFDDAMVAFAEAYARQNQADYERFMAAIAAGELPCAEE